MDHLLKTKKEFKNLKKQETRAIFTKISLIRLAFNTIWLMGILKIKQEEKVLRDKAFNIAKNPKYDEYQRGLASMVYNFLIKSRKGLVLI